MRSESLRGNRTDSVRRLRYTPGARLGVGHVGLDPQCDDRTNSTPSREPVFGGPFARLGAPYIDTDPVASG